MSQTKSTITRKQAAQAFADKWAGRGYEKGDTSSFWLELLRDVVGMEDVTTNVRFEERTAKKGFIDAVIADAKTIIEQKSLGVDLDRPDIRQGEEVTPFQQAFNYANTLPNSQRPDFIIVCDFNQFRIHNLNKVDVENDYISFVLAELPEQLNLLDFLIDPQKARQKREEKVSMEAGALIGKLYQELREQFLDPDSDENQHALNVLCVRLVFCLFAEEAGLFNKDAFHDYLYGAPAHLVRGMLKDLFEVLNTPVKQRDPYLDDALKAFPYVNGGLFAKPEEIPPFTPDLLELLLNEVSQDTNWSEISPTIFGGVFESTLNPETRAQGGMHYTSPENIHKVIDPLFLDGLKTELTEILEAEGLTPIKRRNRLRKLHEKIGSLSFFDPACGSGNFLTETYISLRKIENKILSELTDQTTMAFEDIDAASPLKVSLNQFYGIEINDFAVSVASTALWIAQLQANIEAQTIITSNIEDLPLVDAAHIVYGNALRMNWSELLRPDDCSFIIGNPPFLGYSRLSDEQKADRLAIFGKSGGVLDFVACWHRKAAEFMKGTSAEAAFVSTNSICQGQQVSPLWKPLFEAGIKINFAHRTFTWTNEAAHQASVFCIIVGFAYVERDDKVVFDYRRATKEEREQGLPREIATAREVDHLNAYLAAAPDAFIERRSKPLGDVPPMAQGFKPADGGNLLLSAEERDELLRAEPAAQPWIRRFSMGADFIAGRKRYCLWLPLITGTVLKQLPEVRSRIEACRQWRIRQIETGDAHKLAVTPHLLRPTARFKDENYIACPKVSSERRAYVPMGFVDDGMIPGDMLYFIPTDSLFVFGILMSQFQNAWMRVVAGRLKSDYRYGNTTVYNNLVWPDTDDSCKEAVKRCAQEVLVARTKYPDATLADMYDPDNDFLYPELTKAHKDLDAAVEKAYGVDFSDLEDTEREQAIVAHLFNLYNEKTSS